MILIAVTAASVVVNAGLFPAKFDVESLRAKNNGNENVGFVVTGESAGDLLSVNGGIGDINGDGIDDIAAGAGGADANGFADAGKVYVIYGQMQPFGNELAVSTLEGINGGDGSKGFVINGYQVGGGAATVRGIGDFNGDGHKDLAIGAFGAPSNGLIAPGITYVLFGGESPFPVEVNLADLLSINGGDGSEGFVIHGVDEYSRSRHLAVDGDINNDGLSDLVIGSSRADVGNNIKAGEVFVIFGTGDQQPAERDLSEFRPENGATGESGFVVRGLAQGDRLGDTGRFGLDGDVNGDGIDDLLIGRYLSDANGVTNSGSAYVIFGGSESFGSEFDLTTLEVSNGGDGSNGFIIHGMDSDDFLGSRVTAGADINGDGLADIIVSASGADPHGASEAGEVYVVFGRSTPFPAEYDISDLLAENGGDGSEGFVLEGTGSSEYLGFGTMSLGDLNGDGADDFSVSGYIFYDEYIIFGRIDPFPSEIQIADLQPVNGGNGSIGMVIPKNTENNFSAVITYKSADVNADGVDELVVSRSSNNANDVDNSGESFILYGRAPDLDTDGDGLINAQDNCIQNDNPDQFDADSDGIGNTCDADFDNNCITNFLDIGLFANAFSTNDPIFDIDQSGTVNFLDYSVVVEYFLNTPGPSGISNVCD